jgi:hypothetical protein
VGHTGVAKLGIRMDRTPKEPAEKGGRRRPVEAMIVIEDSDAHFSKGKTYQLA